jgi:hypothetical protein
MTLHHRILAYALLLGPAASLCGGADLDTEAALRKSLGKSGWYGIYINAQKSGYAFIECRADQVDGRDAVTFSIKMHMKVTTLGQKQDLRMVEERTYLRTGPVHSFYWRMKTGPSDVESSATVEGDKLVMEVRTGAVTKSQELPKPKTNLADALAPERLLLPGAKIGDQVVTTEFVPTLLKEVESTLVLKERKPIVYNGIQTQVSLLVSRIPALSVDSDIIVSEQGEVLELTVGAMFVLRLEPEKVAKDITYSADLIRAGCVRLDPPPKQVVRLRRARFQFRGIEDPALLINDAQQQWARQPDGSQIVTTTVRPVDPARVPRLPVDRNRFQAELASTMLVQSDDPQIRATAAAIVGTETDAWAAARRINAWVFRTLRKVGAAAMSNAVETLATREGDCTEHTVLFVALARAAGIPARECAGVVAIEGGEGLYYHAWPEVWVGEWIAVDPTLGQEIADATHIKFAQGGTENLFRICALFGRISAKLLDSATE